MRVVARAVLAAAVVLAGCSSAPPPAPALDADAQAACDTLAPIAGDVRTGELEGPELYRALQDVWDAAQRSPDAAVRNNAQALLTAAIQDDQKALSTSLTALQRACNLPFE